MEQNLGRLVWQSFKKMYGAPGLIVAIVLWWVVPSDTVSWKVVVPGALVAALLISTLLDALLAMHKQTGRLPRVLAALEVTGPEEAEGSQRRIRLLLEASPSFSHAAVVTCYYLGDDGFESQIGAGYVENVQADKKIAVVLDEFVAGQEDKLDKLRSRDPTTLQRIMVKPFTTRP